MQKQAKHWLIDIADPPETYSAFRFSRDASSIIRQRALQGAGTMLCGGTGLYFQALQNGLGPEISQNPLIREKYVRMAHELGNNAVFEKLLRVDPVTAASSHPANLVRNIRALEVFETSGIALSILKKESVPSSDFEFLVCILSVERETLYGRINQRVDAMVRQGLWDEFRGLIDRGYTIETPGMRCVGYRELFDVKDQFVSFTQAIDAVKQHTRHYAKRQMTWFRHQVKGIVFDALMPDAFSRVCREMSEFLSG